MLLLFGLILVLSACGGNDEAENNTENNTGNNTSTNDTTQNEADNQGANEGNGTVDVAQAEKIFSNTCAQCHGGNLEGAGGPNLTQVGAKYDKGEIEHIINEGQGGMPGGMVTEEEASILAAWLSEKK